MANACPMGGVPVLIGELVAVRVVPSSPGGSWSPAVPAVVAQLQVGKTPDSARSAIIWRVKASSRSSSGRSCQFTQLIWFVLTVGVVVAELAALISSPARKWASPGTAAGVAMRLRFCCWRRLFTPGRGRPSTVVAGEVVAVAVPVVLAVGLVGAGCRNQILEGEAVVIAG